MNGAQALIRTLVDSGVEICFGNPGTSEMHFVAALDDVPEMRGVLGLHETVVTGAADGYARIAGKPAATLLHLGPGVANGLANLHNARRAHTPVVNVIGDHATYHAQYDAPLQSDISALNGFLEGWYRTSTSTAELARDAAEAVAAARSTPGRIANLVLPADVSWGDGGEPAAPVDPAAPVAVAQERIDSVAEIVRAGDGVMILLGGGALLEAGLLPAAAIAAGTGAQLIAESFPTRIERGAGLPTVHRLGYLAEQMEAQMQGIKHLVLATAKAPSSFFAYPGRPSNLVPDGCAVHTLAELGDDVVGALERLRDAVAGGAEAVLQPPWLPEMPSGDLNAHTMAETVACSLPENVIIVDESNTSGASLPFTTIGAPRHDLLTLTGGAIGYGMPAAVGAALARPDRHVLNLQADGSAMYSVSALWTQARENLDVTTVILNNSAYSILRMELQRVGAETSGEKAGALLDLSRPNINFVPIAQGMGVPAVRVTTCEQLADEMGKAFAEPGPHLIDAVLPPLF